MKDFKILPKHICTSIPKKSKQKKTAIIAHLYYDDKIDKNFVYLLNVPSKIDVYIITANAKLKEKAAFLIKKTKSKNIQIIEKENRGRDFAALLVTSKKIVMNYDYICFVHDKKSHYGNPIEKGELWEHCFFENTLCSEEYIYNIINLFEKEKNIGFLSVPAVPDENLANEYGDLWTINQKNVLDIAKKLKLSIMPDFSEDPLSVGSAFWFRREAALKLFKYNFTYESFGSEPMPMDGVLAHSIERIWPYVALDAGYSSAIIMNDEYAQYYVAKQFETLTNAISIIRESGKMSYKNRKMDLSQSLNFIRYGFKGSELLKYAIHYKYIFIFTDNTQTGLKLVDKCKKEFEENDIYINEICTLQNYKQPEILQNYAGVVVCCSKENKKEFENHFKELHKKCLIF